MGDWHVCGNGVLQGEIHCLQKKQKQTVYVELYSEVEQVRAVLGIASDCELEQHSRTVETNVSHHHFSAFAYLDANGGYSYCLGPLCPSVVGGRLMLVILDSVTYLGLAAAMVFAIIVWTHSVLPVVVGD